ncbi:MAG: DUF190 domain-containing protein [Desulfobacteraceae bacterium]|nr:DUF190 domain-containing protein [Desulfobacteraceae bacterium]
MKTATTIAFFCAGGGLDRYDHKPLYEALVELFRKEGFAGATVLRGQGAKP